MGDIALLSDEEKRCLIERLLIVWNSDSSNPTALATSYYFELIDSNSAEGKNVFMNYTQE